MSARLLLREAVQPGEHLTYARHRFATCQLGHPHTHDFHEVFWVESGRGVHWINGERRPLQAGLVVLIRAEDEHAFAGSSDDPLLFTNVAFVSDSWRALHRRYFQAGPRYFARRPHAQREWQIDRDTLFRIGEVAWELHLGARSRVALERFLLNLFALLPEPDPEAAPMGRLPQAPAWIARLCQALRNETDFRGGTQELARRAGRSPEHVAREFRRYLGTTPTAVINEARMHLAARRLATTEDKIIDIASDCGLDNLGHFYRLFRAKYGVTPRSFRLRQQHAVRRGH